MKKYNNIYKKNITNFGKVWPPMGGGQSPPLITKSPTKNGSNHHITNKKWLKSPSPSVPSDHQSPNKNLQITTYFLAPKRTFLLKNGHFRHFFAVF